MEQQGKMATSPECRPEELSVKIAEQTLYLLPGKAHHFMG